MPAGRKGEERLGVVGAGTMGAGIALAALRSGMAVTLVDPVDESRAAARAYLQNHLERKGEAGALERAVLTSRFEDLADCALVIEAAPEDLRLKQSLFADLDRLLPPPVILATNTSTLSVTAIASATRHPERVAGLHFFNPVPLMPLVEVARASRTDEATIAGLLALVERLGKTPVSAADTPGFIVNRIARPFYGEALRILGEGTATHDQIDRIIAGGGGFRMGPFRLMDLIGLDVNFAATMSMWEQTFGEPRYRPHPIQARMVEQGALGRKTGRGFYRYDVEAGPGEEPVPPPAESSGRVVVTEGTWAPGLETRLQAAGFTIERRPSPGTRAAFVVAGREEQAEDLVRWLDLELAPDVPMVCQTSDQLLAEVRGASGGGDRLVGIDGWFAGSGSTWTMVGRGEASDAVRSRVEALAQGVGVSLEWINDGAGLVLPRVMSMLANEAAFALAEGTADEATIDLAMKLGANYPIGPLEWLRQVGAEKVLRVLAHLRAVFAEERYRVAPLLRRRAQQTGRIKIR